MGAEIIFFFRKPHAEFSFLLTSKAAKDLIEYAFVLSLIAFGAVTSLNSLSGALTKVFQGFSTTLCSFVS